MRSKIEKAQQWIFLAAFFLYFWRLYAFMMEYSWLIPIDLNERKWLYYAVLALSGCAMLLRGWNVLDMIIYAFSFCVYYSVQFNDFSVIVLFLIVARGLDTRWVVKIWFGMHSVLVILCVLLYPYFYSTGASCAKVMHSGSGAIRYTFFFNHCNGIGVTVAFWALAFVFLYYKRVPYLVSNAVLLGAAAFCFFAPKSKTATGILILCMALLALWRYLPNAFRVLMWIGLPGLLILVIGIVGGYYYGIIPPDYALFSADTYTARFVDAAVALKLYRPTLLGQNIYNIEQFVQVDQFARVTCFDMGLLRIFVQFGIVGGVIFYGAVFRSMWCALRKEKWLQAIMILLMMIYFVMEWLPFGVMFPLLFANDVFDVRFKPLLRYGRYGLRAKAYGPESAVEP